MFKAQMQPENQFNINTATSLEQVTIPKQESVVSKGSSAIYRQSVGYSQKNQDTKSIVSQSSLDFEERYKANMLNSLLGVISIKENARVKNKT